MVGKANSLQKHPPVRIKRARNIIYFVGSEGTDAIAFECSDESVPTQSSKDFFPLDTS